MYGQNDNEQGMHQRAANYMARQRGRGWGFGHHAPHMAQAPNAAPGAPMQPQAGNPYAQSNSMMAQQQAAAMAPRQMSPAPVPQAAMPKPMAAPAPSGPPVASAVANPYAQSNALMAQQQAAAMAPAANADPTLAYLMKQKGLF